MKPENDVSAMLSLFMETLFCSYMCVLYRVSLNSVGPFLWNFSFGRDKHILRYEYGGECYEINNFR